jgi:curved DNA-binding protein CbpA
VSGVAEPGVRDDPFAVLGLPARAGLSDEDVRAAWRRIAATTHPDREDGGDPAVFGAAAAAYVTLRTSFGRGEALADLGDVAATGSARRPGRHRASRGRVRRGAVRRGSGTSGLRNGLAETGARLRNGLARRGGRIGAGAVFAVGTAARIVAGARGRVLAVRVFVAAAASAVAFLAAGWCPGTAGVLTGALSWLLITALRR